VQRRRQRRAAGGFEDQPESPLRLLDADHHVGRTQFPQPGRAFRPSRYRCNARARTRGELHREMTDRR
jgi:hypothetical protein